MWFHCPSFIQKTISIFDVEIWHKEVSCIDIVERYVEYNNPNVKSKELARLKMEERNKIKYVGSYDGTNCMGKILKLCQLALLNGTEPPIDYDLLRSKQIYLLGKLLTF